MNKIVVACIQPRMSIVEEAEGFRVLCRRYLRQAQAKSAQVAVFPELAGIMLAPPLASRLKLGVIRRMDEGRRPGAGAISRAMGRVADATATALGGGLRGSLSRILAKNRTALLDLYLEAFGGLAREYGMVVVGGTLYLYDEESATVRNRAYLFGPNGDPLGYQDKLNLAPGDAELATPGSEVRLFDTNLGRFGVLIGRDALFPELSRALAVLGTDLLIGIDASPDEAQARMIRSALALRAEENQVFVASSFLLGPNYLDPEHGEEYVGQSALMAPISLTAKGDGVIVQTGTLRNEGVVVGEVDGAQIASLRASGRFRPRQQMQLGSAGPILAHLYGSGLTIDQAVEERMAEEPGSGAGAFAAGLPAVDDLAAPEEPAAAEILPAADQDAEP